MLVHTLDLPGFRKVASGKVREIFDLGSHLLLVATDRLSAFDCILPNPIPHKGAVLTGLSAFWFQRFTHLPNHLVSLDPVAFEPRLAPYAGRLEGRSMVVKKAQPLPVECVVRGYLAGSGWKEYRETGAVCGQPLADGYEQAAQLPHPFFTPTTKATAGHDEGISDAEFCAKLGSDLAERVRDAAIGLYEAGRDYAAERGIIVADTKFEFGLCEGELMLIDECLTPDSSRFWPAAEYRTGISPPSFDKQYVRDYLETLAWEKTPPAPELPPEVIARTSEKYLEARRRIAGRDEVLAPGSPAA